MKDFSHLLSEVNKRVTASAIRELLKIIGMPGMISFAGGLPTPEMFPAEELGEIAKQVIASNPNKALQYGCTEGAASFKEELINLLKKDENIEVSQDEMLVVSASQQGLDIVSKAFVDPGDAVIVAKPTYLGALQAFETYGADMVGVESDDFGIIAESLEEKLEDLKKAGRQCKFIYIVPDFQNPTGTTIPEERRVKILELAKKYGTIILEDSPYRKVRFKGEHQKTFYALDKGEGNVITMFTFSKTLAPGLRLGYIIGDKELIRKFVILKQALDLCTSPACQAIAEEYLKRGNIEKHIAEMAKLYGKKRDVMIAALRKYMPQGVSWTEPEGGLFLWVVMPENIDSEKMLETAIKNNVAYVMGSAFYPDGSGKNTMRLNFSYSSFEEIDEGIKRLAKAITEYGK